VAPLRHQPFTGVSSLDLARLRPGLFWEASILRCAKELDPIYGETMTRANLFNAHEILPDLIERSRARVRRPATPLAKVASNIAKRLNAIYPDASLTRNAVIGKVSRMGLPTRAMGPRGHGRLSAKRVRVGKANCPKPKPLSHIKASAASKAELDEILARQVIDDVARVTFEDLGPNHCRFPIGDPKDANFGYCGQQKVHGLPYCKSHAAPCYTAPDARKHETRRGPADGVSNFENAAATKEAETVDS